MTSSFPIPIRPNYAIFRLAGAHVPGTGVRVKWNDFKKDVSSSFLQLARDFIVVAILFIAIWALNWLEDRLYPTGLIFFKDTKFAFAADLLLSAADASLLSMFLVKTVYFVAKGVFRK